MTVSMQTEGVKKTLTHKDMVVKQAKEIANQRDSIENEVLAKTQSLREQLLARDAQRDR